MDASVCYLGFRFTCECSPVKLLGHLKVNFPQKYWANENVLLSQALYILVLWAGYMCQWKHKLWAGVT